MLAYGLTMAFDMRHLESVEFEEPGQSASLVQDGIVERTRSQVHLPPPEPLQVGQAGVTPNVDPVRLGQRDRLGHDIEIRGVETARDVGKIQQGHQLLVGAEVPGPVGFSHVDVDRSFERHGAG